MSDNPVLPLTPAPTLGAGWRTDATGRAFYSSAWLDDRFDAPPWNLPAPDEVYACDPSDNPEEW